MRKWYKDHLGIPTSSDGFGFEWRDKSNPDDLGMTVWSIFPQDTKYFGNQTISFMLNYRVENLDRVLEELRSVGVIVEEKIEEYEFGRFVWLTDPEGNRIELWEPKRK